MFSSFKVSSASILKKFFRSLLDIVGRQSKYRLGRSLYMSARGDIPNAMNSNGEMYLQMGVVSAWNKNHQIDEGLVVFDVGANVGDWTGALLEVLRRHAIVGGVDVFLFEPVPATVKALRTNLPPDCLFLHVEEIALSSASGMAEIFVSGENSGTNTLHSDTALGENEAVKVRLSTATEFCDAAGIGHVHLLKCDTEGHDMEVIRGSLLLLQTQRISVLQFEYNHRWIFSRNYLRDAFSAVHSLPYSLAKLQSDHILVFDVWQPELERFFEGNYALVHDNALSWFNVKSASFDSHNALLIAQ
jgi:FkbM family methyltransferase